MVIPAGGTESISLSDALIAMQAEVNKTAAEKAADQETERLEDFMVTTEKNQEEVDSLKSNQEVLSGLLEELAESKRQIAENEQKYADKKAALEQFYVNGVADATTRAYFLANGITKAEDLFDNEIVSQTTDVLDYNASIGAKDKLAADKAAKERAIRKDLGIEDETVDVEEKLKGHIDSYAADIDEIKSGKRETITEAVEQATVKMQGWFESERSVIADWDDSLGKDAWLNNLSKMKLVSPSVDLTPEADLAGMTVGELWKEFYDKKIQDHFENQESRWAQLKTEADEVRNKKSMSISTSGDRWQGERSFYRDTQGYEGGYSTSVDQELKLYQYEQSKGRKIGVNEATYYHSELDNFPGSGINVWDVKCTNEVVKTQDGRSVIDMINAEEYKSYRKNAAAINQSAESVARALGSKQSEAPLGKYFDTLSGKMTPEALLASATNISPEQLKNTKDNIIQPAIEAFQAIRGKKMEDLVGVEVTSEYAELWTKFKGDQAAIERYLWSIHSEEKDIESASAATENQINLELDTAALANQELDPDVVSANEKLRIAKDEKDRNTQTAQAIIDANDGVSFRIINGNFEVRVWPEQERLLQVDLNSKQGELAQLESSLIATKKRRDERKLLELGLKKDDDIAIKAIGENIERYKTLVEEAEQALQGAVDDIENRKKAIEDFVDSVNLTDSEKTTIISGYGSHDMKELISQLKNRQVSFDNVSLSPAETEAIEKRDQISAKIYNEKEKKRRTEEARQARARQ